MDKENVNYWKWFFVGAIGLFIFFQFFDVKIKPRFGDDNESQSASVIQSNFEEVVLPSEGIVLPVRWEDLGMKLVSTGVIDGQKLDLL